MKCEMCPLLWVAYCLWCKISVSQSTVHGPPAPDPPGKAYRMQMPGLRTRSGESESLGAGLGACIFKVVPRHPTPTPVTLVSPEALRPVVIQREESEGLPGPWVRSASGALASLKEGSPFPSPEPPPQTIPAPRPLDSGPPGLSPLSDSISCHFQNQFIIPLLFPFSALSLLIIILDKPGC